MKKIWVMLPGQEQAERQRFDDASHRCRVIHEYAEADAGTVGDIVQYEILRLLESSELLLKEAVQGG